MTGKKYHAILRMEALDSYRNAPNIRTFEIACEITIDGERIMGIDLEENSGFYNPRFVGGSQDITREYFEAKRKIKITNVTLKKTQEDAKNLDNKISEFIVKMKEGRK